MKTITKKVTTATLSLLLALTAFAGCGPNGGDESSAPITDSAVKDAKVCNIQVLKAGYGVDWLYDLKAKFEKAYEAEGYKLNILIPSSDMRGTLPMQLMAQGYETTGTDLYITADFWAPDVGKFSEYGQIASDLKANVYDKPAIRYDGTEEAKTVSEKLDDGIEEYSKDVDGTYYSFPWVNSASGLVVNTKKLAKYGLSLPKTTNEMFDCFDKIYLGHNGIENSEESKTFPITYVAGANGYTMCFIDTLLAQYDFEDYTKFYSMQEANGTLMTENGYEVYNLPGVIEMLDVMYRTFDVNISSYGSTTQQLDQAQAAIMKSNGYNAVFMFNGDWMLNEVKLNYKNNLHDIAFINNPVISALGTKLFGTGTSYNFNDAKCEELLSYIIGLVDENKSIDEMIASVASVKGVTVAEKDVQEIARARGVYFNRGIEHQAYIAEDAKAKDVAELVLRMMASDDFAQTFAQYSNGTTPYTTLSNTYTEYEFVEQASKLPINRYQTAISSHKPASHKLTLRSKLGVGQFSTTSHIVSTISTNSDLPSMYDGEGGRHSTNSASVYRQSAQSFLTSEISNLQKNWNTWLKNAGF